MTFINKLRFLTYSLTILLLLTTVLFYSTADSNAQEFVCPPRGIDQITNTFSGVNEDPSLNMDGRYVAFESSANFTGENPDGSDEIFLFDTTTRDISQITSDPNFGSFDPKINGDGSRITFETDADLIGQNPNNIRQIYLFDESSNTITQITTDPGEDSNDPSIDKAGTRIAFETDADINGGNPDNNDDIYVFDTNSTTFIQITGDPNDDSINPSISGDGSKVAFQSSANINGGNPNNVNQIYIADVGSGVIMQITDDPIQASTEPSANMDGQFVAFRSTANLTGENPDNNSEIFLADTRAGTLTQITITTDGFSQLPSINGDGTKIAFESASNLNDNNPNGIREIWLYDTTTGNIIQITDVPEGSSNHASISGDGMRIGFDSRSNIKGGNPDLNREVYIATCFDPATYRNIPTLSEWGLIAMIGVLGFIGLFVITRRKLAA